ncbi:hypothetical protein FACS1894208_02050 [Clostridia bacterium]|nr:hypothetical protein FACS1894208_02050 [Clostridia bacterium]
MEKAYFYLDEQGTISGERAAAIKKLSVLRLRDRDTGRERLSFELYDRAEDTRAYATVYCSPLDLQRDLTKLREYGIVIPRKEVMRLAQFIETDYYKIECVPDEDARTLDSDMPDILRHICGFIKAKKLDSRLINDHELYNIPVNDFRVLFKSCEFSRHSQRDIRRKLHEKGYTTVSRGRYDNTIKGDNDAPIKVISLFADDPDIVDIMQALSEK